MHARSHFKMYAHCWQTLILKNIKKQKPQITTTENILHRLK